MKENGELGRFGNHPDPADDFCAEVEELQAMKEDHRLGLVRHPDFEARLSRALDFTVGGNLFAINCKRALREIAEGVQPK